MKKRILCLAMIAIMALGIPMTANAETIEGSKDWKVTFENGALESNFKGSDAADEVLKNLQPGDTIHLQIKLENKSGKKADWYMANEVIKSLEDSSESDTSIAAGGAYTYVLSYKDSSGKEEVIYSSERVGGELQNTRTTADEGLHQATNSLEEYFYLDRLENGKTGSVHLEISLDGETQGNDYQETLASLKMLFAAEAVKEVKVNKVEKVEGKKEKVVVQERQIVTTAAAKTGDAAPIVLFSTIALASGIVLIFAAMKQMKGRQKGEQ